eukprot:jgi/Bigna1/88516/estExt_fgenesh1_pg.C_330078
MGKGGAMGGTGEIDESLYSRQLYVFGHEAQRRMQESSVLLLGLDGLGVELAKNIILAGVKEVGLHDDSKALESHRASQFYIPRSAVGQPLAAACRNQLAELNSYVDVHVAKGDMKSLIRSKRYTVIVAINKTVQEQIDINEICRECSLKFISADVAGLLGAIFVDLGPSHFVSDPDGERPRRGLIKKFAAGKPAVITTAERHGLSTGDLVTLEEMKLSSLNAIKPRQIKYINSTSFSISVEDVLSEGSSSSTGGGYFQQVKRPMEVAFSPLKKCISAPQIASDMGEGFTLHATLNGISEFRKQRGGGTGGATTPTFPSPSSSADAKSVYDLAVKFAKDQMPDAKEKVDEKLCRKLARTSSAVIAPMAAVIGGIAGQEVLKAVSGKFTPIKQFYYFTAAKCLPAEEEKEDEDEDGTQDRFEPDEAQHHRYDDYVAVFGKDVQAKMSRLNIFLVGAGAIGCEMLKNFALMGVGAANASHQAKKAEESKTGGVVTVTDMDAIERSNLNRQFFFPPWEVGKLKFDAAFAAARKINGDFKVVSHSHRVGKESEEIYDEAFWSGLNPVVTALDNVQARLYLDNSCIHYLKPMFDSGTLGTKGNTQVVLPKLTESYGSSQDPPEESIPLCTLHNFPHKARASAWNEERAPPSLFWPAKLSLIDQYPLASSTHNHNRRRRRLCLFGNHQIEHTIQWARDKFEGLFKLSASEVNSYLTETNYLAKLAEDSVNEVKNLELLNAYLGDDKPLSFEDCIHWARRLFETEFNNKIVQLLIALPPDKTDSEGNPFWTGHKRPPSPLKFDPENELHLEFVVAAANLHAVVYGLEGSRNKAAIKKEIAKVVIKAFVPEKGHKVAKNDEEMKAMMEEESHGLDSKIERLKSKLPQPSELTGYQLNPVVFEKDDASNFHIDFITACSNLRAANYKIKSASKHQTKQIAGKIIPAIATTTAMVAGLVCLELYKLAQGLKLEHFSNTYANLAIGHITASEPLEPEFKEVEFEARGKKRKLKFSLWDKMEVKIGSQATLQDLVDHFEEKFGLDIVMLNFGRALLYSQYGFGAKRKNKVRLKLSIPELVKTVAKVEVNMSSSFLTLGAMVTTLDGDDVDIPADVKKMKKKKRYISGAIFKRSLALDDHVCSHIELKLKESENEASATFS